MIIEEIDFVNSLETTTLNFGSLMKRWENIVKILDFAFQPIINIHTGICFGYEVLVRNYEEAGFQSIQDLFDSAFADNMLSKLDLWLIEKVLNKFVKIPFYEKTKIFFNIDNRLLLMPDYSPNESINIVEDYQLHPGSFCIEISEKHDFSGALGTNGILNQGRRKLYKIAIDDFGTGFSGLQLLYHTEPDYIKIDRFFIKDIATDSRKKLFVATTLSMAHTLGILVIAEGIETEKEFYECKNIGCDLVQGYLFQKPTTDLQDLLLRYDNVIELNKKDRRDHHTDKKLILNQMEYIEPINLFKDVGSYTDMSTVYQTFRKNENFNYFPLLNGNSEPIGLLREKDLKEFVYSRYGTELLINKTLKNYIAHFNYKCPVSEINTSVEKILEIYSVNEQSEGIILSENGKYAGFLSTQSLLKLLNEKNIAEARDQNPLTKLPGNNLINQYISVSLENFQSERVFAYFDFDHFKPFNDKFGFRQGDRAILLFADILREISNTNKSFIGHVGGDDFFAGFVKNDNDTISIPAVVRHIIERFCNDVQSLYDAQDRINNYIISTDRQGNTKKYPLMGVSVAVLYLPSGKRNVTIDELFLLLAKLKKQAKESDEKIAVFTVMDECAAEQ